MGLVILGGFAGFLIGAMLTFIVNMIVGLAVIEKQKREGKR